AHGGVEWTHGRLRNRRVREGHDGNRAGRRQRERDDNRRRRRFDCGGEEGGRRVSYHAHLPGRRRVARVSRRSHAPWRGCFVRQMRTPFIAGNWKMHKTVADTVKYVKELRGLVKDITGVEIVVAPPFTA